MDINAIIFRNPTTDDSAVLRAISQIPVGGAPVNLWTDVANDLSYRPFHRAAAIYELFRRHFVRPATLEQIASLLAGGRWLLDAVLEKIGSIGGEIPVQVPPGGTAFVLRLRKDPAAAYPQVGIYLALDGELDANLLRDALMSIANGPAAGKVRIVDYAVFPERLAPTPLQQ